MPEKPKTKRGLCPHCGGSRNAFIRGEYERSGSNEDLWWKEEYRILECSGCETIFIERQTTTSESQMVYDEELQENVPEGEVTYWPAIEKFKRPDWMTVVNLKDRPLRRTLEQTYHATNTGDLILAGGGLRTAIDRTAELLKVNPAITFAEKLDALLQQGWIGAREKEHLEVLVNAGNATTHRAWEPTEDQLKDLFPVLESFLYRSFVTREQIKAIKKLIPKKQRRREKTRL